MSFRSKRIALWAMVAATGSLFGSVVMDANCAARRRRPNRARWCRFRFPSAVSRVLQRRAGQHARTCRTTTRSTPELASWALSQPTRPVNRRRVNRRPSQPAASQPRPARAVRARPMAANVPTACTPPDAPCCRLPASHHSQSMAQRQGFRGGQAGRHLQHGASPGARCSVFSGSEICRRIFDRTPLILTLGSRC